MGWNLSFLISNSNMWSNMWNFMQQVAFCNLIPHFSITVSDFTDTLAQLYEKHAEELQVVVSNFRKKNGELRKEVSCIKKVKIMIIF